MFKTKWLISLFLAASLGLGSAAQAEGTGVEGGGADVMCEDSGLWGPKLFTDICWACLFPIKIAGVQITPGRAPEKAAKAPFCICEEGTSGIFKPGLVVSMWEPARLVEIVRKPGCAPSLGGATLNMGSFRSYGRLTQEHHTETTHNELSFYQAHYYAFPLLQILDLYSPTKCNADGYLDFDIISFTEIDPTWNNPVLAFFQHPESAAVANPIAIAACAVESLALAAQQEPIESMWWCTGTWGGIYPLSGFNSPNDFNRTTALNVARLLAQQHRRGLARRTMGESNVCRASIYPTIPKSQYKLNQFTPKAQTQKGVWLGEIPYQWEGGPGRHIPGTPTDAVYMLWRWTDCCSKL